MLKDEYLFAAIGFDTAENEQVKLNFWVRLPAGLEKGANRSAIVGRVLVER